MTRVLVVFGSETGTAEDAAKAMAKSLAARDDGRYEIVDVVEGNSVGALAGLNRRCDVLLVTTSSFGDGDPPGNFGLFVASLLKASQAGTKPLAGLQHAVAGFGSTEYETFQNCPRLTDKYLGECGSRRFVRRAELDSVDDSTQGQLETFEAAVVAGLQAGPEQAGKKPVCDWAEPKSQIYEKTREELLLSSDGPGNANGLALMGMGALIVLFGALIYHLRGAGTTS